MIAARQRLQSWLVVPVRVDVVQTNQTNQTNQMFQKTDLRRNPFCSKGPGNIFLSLCICPAMRKLCNRHHFVNELLIQTARSLQSDLVHSPLSLYCHQNGNVTLAQRISLAGYVVDDLRHLIKVEYRYNILFPNIKSHINYSIVRAFKLLEIEESFLMILQLGGGVVNGPLLKEWVSWLYIYAETRPETHLITFRIYRMVKEMQELLPMDPFCQRVVKDIKQVYLKHNVFLLTLQESLTESLGVLVLAKEVMKYIFKADG